MSKHDTAYRVATEKGDRAGALDALKAHGLSVGLYPSPERIVSWESGHLRLGASGARPGYQVALLLARFDREFYGAMKRGDFAHALTVEKERTSAMGLYPDQRPEATTGEPTA